MTDPVFWLGMSILLVAVSLTAVLIALLPAVQALARAARSVEKLADTLSREFPPTLEAIRLTGLEISELTDDVSEGVQTAGEVVKQVDQSLGSAKKQAQKVQATTRSVFTGLQVAWKTFTRKPGSAGGSGGSRRSGDRLSPSQRSPLSLRDSTLEENSYPRDYLTDSSESAPPSLPDRESPRYRPNNSARLPANSDDLDDLGL